MMSTKTYGRVLRRNEKLISLSYHSCFFHLSACASALLYQRTFAYLSLVDLRSKDLQEDKERKGPISQLKENP